MYQVTSPYFCTGVVTKGFLITEAGPILKHWIGRSIYRLKTEAAMRGWKAEVIMARGRSRGGSRPSHYIAVTAKTGKGRYEKGPYIGLWEGDGERNSPLFRGSSKGKYLDELFDFIKDYGDDEIGFAIFESRGDRGGRKERDDSDRDDSDRGSRRKPRSRDDDEDEEPRSKRGSSKRRSRDEDEEEEKPRGRGKKKDWFDD